MDGTEYQNPIEEGEDICDSILSRYGNSKKEDHRHLCNVVGCMSQELKDQKLPLTPISYFGAAMSSLDRLSVDSKPSDPLIAALLTFLSMLLPKISVPLLKKKMEYVSGLLLRILRAESASVVAIISGMKCITHIILVNDNVSWSEISPLYVSILGFITNAQPKVRKQARLCLRDILQSCQKRPALLAPASESITNTFERFLLLAGGGNSTDSERPKGAQEVLYILGALNDCLPLMSSKYITSILKYFKSLLELRQPVVTRCITDDLHALCVHPTSEVAPDPLLDLLCSLASSVSLNEKSVDSMMFTARLLDVGVKRVYFLNRQMCVVKLPVVFSALGEILACEHDEALFAAMEALRSLIYACIDGPLIKQGVDQIILNEDEDTRKSRPTIIEKLCATIESTLSYRYNAVWEMSFQIVSAMFNKLGQHAFYLLRGTLRSLEGMQKLPDQDIPSRKKLHECVGSALGAMGPEHFLTLLPLNMNSEELSAINVWLFPILKQYTIGASLNFFKKSILGMVIAVRRKSRALEEAGKIFASRSAEALVYSLWSLLPSFCNYPLDTADSFKNLENELRCALRDEPDVRGIICSSLQMLIQQNKRALEGNFDLPNNEISIPEQRAKAYYTPQVAADNLNILKACASDFLAILSDIIELSKDDGGCLKSTIREFASIADDATIGTMFKSTMQKILKATKRYIQERERRSTGSMQVDHSANENAASLARAPLLDLVASLLPGLNAEQVGVLFVAIKPLLQDNESLIQKKAYKTLSIILKDHDELLSAKLDELLRLMVEVLPSCHFSAKRHRLDCLYFLIIRVNKDASEQRKHDIISSFLTEIVLALKEANKKTRNKAYEILVQIGHACGDEEQGGEMEQLQQFFNMVAGSLCGGTPQMISAAVKGLARLAYEFSDLLSLAYNVLPSSFLLLQRNNRELIKANLGFLKVLVAKSQSDVLHIHLKSMVEGLLNWKDEAKTHFKAKVKHLLEMLVRKCGLDAVKAVMPEAHMKLLTNIRKIKERKERKLAAASEAETESLHSKATTSRQSRWNHTKIFSEFGDEDTDSDIDYMDGKASRGLSASSRFNSKASTSRSKPIRRRAEANKSLPEDMLDQLGDDPLDLLDWQKTRSALQSGSSLKRKQQDSDDEPEIDPEGRLVIREGGGKPKREIALEEDAKSQAGRSHMSSKSLSSKDQKKRRKTSDSGWAYTGNEYASKKAGGDLKRKDKLEPYAYWPLDRKMMSRRPEHRAAARKGMASVVKMTKNLQGKSVSAALSVNKGGLKLKRKQKGKR